MAKGIYVHSPTPEDSGLVILHRVIGKDATDSDADLLVAADVSTVSVKVYKKADGTLITSATPSAATVFPGNRTLGGVVYNFIYETTAAMLPDGDQIYRFEILITPVSGAAFYLDFVEVPTIAAFGS